jgi:hypothetical protein
MADAGGHIDKSLSEHADQIDNPMECPTVLLLYAASSSSFSAFPGSVGKPTGHFTTKYALSQTMVLLSAKRD